MNDLGYVYSTITKIINGVPPPCWPLHVLLVPIAWLHTQSRTCQISATFRFIGRYFYAAFAVSFAKGMPFQGFSGHSAAIDSDKPFCLVS
jgi:hypothetical protein